MESNSVNFVELAAKSEREYFFDTKCSLPGYRFIEDVVGWAHLDDGFWKKRRLFKSLKDKRWRIRFQKMILHISGCSACRKVFNRATQILNEECTSILEGSMGSPLEAAQERGRQAVELLIRENKIVPCNNCEETLTVEISGKKFCLPPETNSLPGFGTVVQTLRTLGHDDWSCLLFFLNPSEYLQGTPVDALRRGRLRAVLYWAENYLNHGA